MEELIQRARLGMTMLLSRSILLAWTYSQDEVNIIKLDQDAASYSISLFAKQDLPVYYIALTC